MTGRVHVARDRLSRRRLLVASAAVPPLALVALATACQQPEFACDHAMGLTPEGLAIRQNLAYLDRSKNPLQTCETCQQFVPAPASGTCASCKVMPGPSHPLGTCKVWAQKT